MDTGREQRVERQRLEILQILDKVRDEICAKLRPAIAERVQYKCNAKIQAVKRNLNKNTPTLGHNAELIIKNFTAFTEQQVSLYLNKYGNDELVQDSNNENTRSNDATNKPTPTSL